MKKAKKNVPSVTEPKPENVKEPEAAVPEAAVPKQEVPPQVATEKPVVVSAPLKNILTRINSLKPNELAIINQFGLPIKDFADWMFMMEQTLRQVPSVTEKGIAEELYKKSMEQRQQTAPGAPSTGNAGAGGLGTILQLLGPMLGGGGSNAMQDRIMNMALESMGLGNALVKAIIIKTAPELATQLLPPLGAPKP